MSTVPLSENVLNQLIKQMDDEHIQEVTTSRDHKSTVSVKFINIYIISKVLLMYADILNNRLSFNTVPYSRNLLREEIFVNLAVLLSEEIFAIFNYSYIAICDRILENGSKSHIFI